MLPYTWWLGVAVDHLMYTASGRGEVVPVPNKQNIDGFSEGITKPEIINMDTKPEVQTGRQLNWNDKKHTL